MCQQLARSGGTEVARTGLRVGQREKLHDSGALGWRLLTGAAKQVLIVDDEVDLLAALSEAFADEGYVVEIAVNGRDALDKLPSMGRPCVMILDLLMPVMTATSFTPR